MAYFAKILVQLCDTWFTYPSFHSFGISHFMDPNSDTWIFGLITKFVDFDEDDDDDDDHDYDQDYDHHQHYFHHHQQHH